MSDLAELFEDPAVARAVLDALVRDATAQLDKARRARRNGTQFAASLAPQTVLDELAELADLPVPAVGSASGTGVATVDLSSSAWVTVTEAAGQFGISAEYVRRLARAGRIRHQRVGRDWLIDIESFANVLRRTA